MLYNMKPPLIVRNLRLEEQPALEAGLHAKEAFRLRRCQIVFASADKQKPAVIAKHLGCATQPVRNVIHDFEHRGLAC